VTDADFAISIRRVGERGEQERAAIIEASLSLFAARGYAHTTIDVVADTAEMSRGTVFNYFCNKEGIILAWACDGHAALAASVDEMIAAGLPPEQILAALWREVRTSHRAHPEAAAVLVREVFSPEPERARAARAAWPLHETAAPARVGCCFRARER